MVPFLSSLQSPAPSPFLRPDAFKLLPIPESPVTLPMLPSLPSNGQASWHQEIKRDPGTPPMLPSLATYGQGLWDRDTKREPDTL